MIQRVATIKEAIAALGGPAKAAKWAGIKPSAVSMWIARGFIWPGYHLRLFIELRQRGYEVDPKLFELTDDQAKVLMSGYQAERKRGRRPKGERGSSATVATAAS